MDAIDLDQAAMPDVPTANMMDSAMDDLFGDGADGLAAAAGIAMAPSALPGALILRISEMQSRGCCTKLAWSNTGSLAQITSDGCRITFRVLIRSRKTGSWEISNESKHPIVAPEGRRFLHIQFNGIGIDLAAVDDFGTVHMCTVTGALGKMTPGLGDLSRSNSNADLNAVVGFHWLALFPAEFRAPYIDAAHKNGDRWETQMRPRDPHALRAHHPSEGKHAFLYISRSTELTLCYQNDGQAWASTSVTLDTVRTSSELVSHAALGEDGNDLLAATYDYSSRMRLYRVSINWNAQQQSGNRGQGVTLTNVQPSLDVHHLTAVDNVRAQQAGSANLTHLHILPPITEAAQSGDSAPTVLAIFTHAALPAEAAQGQTSFSAISRWRVASFTPQLHESFQKLKPGGNSNQVLNQVTVLRRDLDVITPKIVLTLESKNFDTILAFAHSDGSVDFRDRSTMEQHVPLGNTETVVNLPQSGFYYVSGDHNLHTALSCDGSSLALVRPDKKVHAQSMVFTHDWKAESDGVGDNKPFIEAAAACLARQYAFLCFSNLSNDETLAILPVDADVELRSLVLRLIFRMLNRSPDISMHEPNKQQMLVLKEPLVPRALSAQLALDTDSVTGNRSFAGQFAFVVLNLKLAGTALATTCARSDPAQIPPEAIYFIRGLVKWCIDIIIFLVQTIANVKRNLDNDTTPKQAFERLVLSTGNPALHLTLCSFSRASVRFITVWLGKYFQILQAAIPRAHSILERQEMGAVLELAGRMPFKLSQFEQMMSEVDAAIRQSYTQSALGVDRRGEIEISMMVDGAVPPETESAIAVLMTTALPKLLDQINLSSLFFWDTDALSLSNAKTAPGAPKMDVMRKIPLPADAPMRVCRRCQSEMEDIGTERLRGSEMASVGWFPHAQRHCVCMNYWLLAQ